MLIYLCFLCFGIGVYATLLIECGVILWVKPPLLFPRAPRPGQGVNLADVQECTPDEQEEFLQEVYANLSKRTLPQEDLLDGYTVFVPYPGGDEN